jgi:hypothetical protein
MSFSPNRSRALPTVGSMSLCAALLGSALGCTGAGSHAAADGDALHDAATNPASTDDASVAVPVDAGSPPPENEGWEEGAVGPAPARPEGPLLMPEGEVDLEITVDPGQGRRPISAWIYGLNSPEEVQTTRPTLLRSGGNRLTAYNWENNASNAGSDWCFQNDAHLVWGAAAADRPGEVARVLVESAIAHGAAAMLTIPLVDYLAADKDEPGSSPPECTSDIRKSGADYLETRLRRNHVRTDGDPAIDPDLNDGDVYQDAFVRWAERAFPGARLMFSMDNEPDLWAYTHAEVHPDPVTYAEVRDKNIAFATMVKELAPHALTAGFVSFGWAGWTGLNGAPDASGNFVEYYLRAMRAAEQHAGTRLIDLLDVHYYPEARDAYDPEDGEVGTRVTEASTDPAVVAARVQAPRSLWDPTYVEKSWIGHWALGGTAMVLIPDMLAKIDAHYPGTKLSFTEWNFGGGAHISGAIASADVLGIFGREGVFAAAHFGFGDGESFTRAAFRLYRNFDGQGATLGDTSVLATTSDIERTSVYGSIVASDPRRVAIVVLNKDTSPHTARITIAEEQSHASCGVWQLLGIDPEVKAAGVLEVSRGELVYTLPASSASMLYLFD